jgi:hypothetical protein
MNTSNLISDLDMKMIDHRTLVYDMIKTDPSLILTIDLLEVKDQLMNIIEIPSVPYYLIRRIADMYIPDVEAITTIDFTSKLIERYYSEKKLRCRSTVSERAFNRLMDILVKQRTRSYSL